MSISNIYLLELVGGVKGRTELPDYVQKYMKGEIVMDDFITHKFKFEDINKSFDAIVSGDW